MCIGQGWETSPKGRHVEPEYQLDFICFAAHNIPNWSGLLLVCADHHQVNLEQLIWKGSKPNRDVERGARYCLQFLRRRKTSNAKTELTFLILQYESPYLHQVSVVHFPYTA